MPPTRPYTRSMPPELQISIALHLHVPGPAACLPSPRSPYLHASPSLLLQKTSRPLLRQRHRTRSMPPDLPISLRQTPPRPFACSAPLDLHEPTNAAHLKTSISPHLHVPRPAAYLPSSRSLKANTSTSLRPPRTSRAPGLHTTTLPYLHACSPAPYLLISLSLHRRPASRAPHLYTFSSTQLIRPYLK